MAVSEQRFSLLSLRAEEARQNEDSTASPVKRQPVKEAPFPGQQEGGTVTAARNRSQTGGALDSIKTVRQMTNSPTSKK